jgi:hypothetical protein
MQFMVVETFLQGPEPVYTRFRLKGRMAPEGLRYVSSVVSADGQRCYQIMESEAREPLDTWIAAWADLVAFEVIEVISSAEAAARFAPDASRQGTA